MESKDPYYENKKRWRENNRDKMIKSKREYYQRNKERLRITESIRRKMNQKKRNQIVLKWILKNPEKRKINSNFYRSHLLKDCCEWCGSKEFLQRHHPDYSKPEYYLTLCAGCHAKTKNNCKEVLVQHV